MKSWLMWAPFQKKELRKSISVLTEEEKKKVMVFSGLQGLLSGLLIAALFLLIWHLESNHKWIIAVGFVVFIYLINLGFRRLQLTMIEKYKERH